MRECAYGWTCQNSAPRTAALAHWQHHYNCHRPHSAIGGLPPISRLSSSRNNILMTSPPYPVTSKLESGWR
ncbi:integrase core domain-containing protein [Hydrogenophaga sp.]|uniref:integrase core domain-containing protein n=1 Tax=Hydrogenophaga sp. TaxID=1904254 RepID=UPI0039197403